MRQTTAPLCASLGDVFVPFPKAISELKIPRQTAERWLRARDTRLPPVLRVGDRRFVARADLDRVKARDAVVAGSGSRVSAA